MRKRKIQTNEFEKQPTSTVLEEIVPGTAHGVIHNCDSVYMRLKPWCRSVSKGVIEFGELVDILEKLDKYYWKVRTSDNREGYVNPVFIKEVPNEYAVNE